MAEFALIELIRAHTAVIRDDVRLGIGDDAALLLPPAGMELAICTDMLVAGVHFPHSTQACNIGWKSLAVNLSDLAAMGAQPAWATLALAMPDANADWVSDFAQGFGALARQHGLALVGGDTTRGPLTVSVTVHGFVEPGLALRRDAAQIGDTVCVTGTLGDAAAALQIAQPGQALDADATALLERLDRPLPRISAGRLLRGLASACIDISDGLIADLAHVCRLSGVAAEVDAARLPYSQAFARQVPVPARLALQAHGGDDYELCFSVAASRCAQALAILQAAGVAATSVGRIVAGEGVRLLDANRNPVQMHKAGWEHFSE